MATGLVGAERSFVTPAIEAGRDFQYTMKVEYVRDGQAVTDSKKVFVRAGETSTVEFADSAALAAAPSDKAATVVTVSLPAGAKLYVGDKLTDVAPGTNEYRTPELVKGQDYVYEFKAEMLVAGKAASRKERVAFKGGEAVKVDFTDMGGERMASK